MKKHISIFCAALACLALTGCMASSDDSGDDGSTSYNVSFQVDGEVCDTVTVEKNGKVAEPTAPSKAATSTISYVFKGWFNGEEEWDFENDVVSSDIVLVAEWTEEEYTKEYLPSNP